MSQEIAVYAEHSLDKVPAISDWSLRKFNTVEFQRGTDIQLDHETGVITLKPGIYHVTSHSTMTYIAEENMGAEGWPSKEYPNAGYSRIRYADNPDCINEEALVVGSINNANLIPSLIDTYLEFKTTSQIILEHQMGHNLEGIYLSDNTRGEMDPSRWRIFARITFRKV